MNDFYLEFNKKNKLIELKMSNKGYEKIKKIVNNLTDTEIKELVEIMEEYEEKSN